MKCLPRKKTENMRSDLVKYLLADTLSWRDFIWFITLDTFVLIIALLRIKYVIVDLHPAADDNMKRRQRQQLAWALSCMNGLITSGLSVVYFYINIRQGRSLSTISFHLEVTPSAAEMLLGRDNLSIIMITHLALNNIIDLVFGSMYYLEHLNIGTAWIHHIFYCWMIRACINGDAIIFKIKPFTRGLGTLLMLEIPTFILALGRVLPQYRSDFWFGVTFFTFRIVFHAYFILCTVLSNTDIDPGHYFFLISTFTIHCVWFSKWFKTYGVRLITSIKAKRE